MDFRFSDRQRARPFGWAVLRLTLFLFPIAVYVTREATVDLSDESVEKGHFLSMSTRALKC